MTAPVGHIIIDANVAKSAKDPARHQTSAACWRLAQMLLSKQCEVGALMTPLLRDEWKRHASPTMVSWLASMENRGRVRRERDAPVRDLRKAVSRVQSPDIRLALEKDIHISEAAIMHAVPVASRDDKQRRFLADLSEDYPRAGRVQWFNPTSDEGWDHWVSAGCSDPRYSTCGPPGSD